MEKKKNNLIPIVIILIVLVLGLGGFIVYDKVLNNNEDNNLGYKGNQTSSENISDSYYSNLVKNRETTVIYINGSPLNFLLDKNGDVYYHESYKYSINTTESKKDYVIKDYVLSHDGSNIYHGYKLDISNVLMIYYGYTGQGGYGTFVFIKENGDVATLTVNPDSGTNSIGEKEVSIIKLEENKNLKNIVAVTEYDAFDGQSLKVIDINGAQYNLSGMKLTD